MNDLSLENKQIEDIIDARKRNGEFNITFNKIKLNSQSTCRYVYSAPTGFLEEKFIIPDECAIWNTEGDLNSDRDGNVTNIGPTDSEITVVRVKRESLQLKQSENNWDMHDKAIPGDGTHLGESPSLVNLVTLINSSKESINTTNNTSENVEYMVPLSSWDPLDENPEILPVDSETSKMFSVDNTLSDEENVSPQTSQNYEIMKSHTKSNVSNLAGKLSVFFRKYFKKRRKSESE